MSSKTDTKVIIGGKVFTLSGYESEEYLQKIASYVNHKMNEYGKVDSFRRQPLDTQSVLLQLNIADDYFKAKRQIALLEEDLQSREKDLYDLKHELISSQIKLEHVEKQYQGLQAEMNESAKKIVRLETRLNEPPGAEKGKSVRKTKDTREGKKTDFTVLQTDQET
jgi:cell division protein ZapA